MNEIIKENLAEIIPFPGIKTYITICCICQKKGSFEAYTIFELELAKCYFYCNNCRCHHPKGNNIDIENAPELSGRNVIPKGVIAWEREN